MNENILHRKSKRGPVKCSRQPINLHHKEKEKYFKDLQASLPQLRNQLKALEKKVTVLKKECTAPKDKKEKDAEPAFMCCSECLRNRRDVLDIRDQIKQKREEIRKIEVREEETEYYSNTSRLLSEYNEPTQTTNRTELSKQYLDITNIEPDYKKVSTFEFDICQACGSARVYDPVEGILVCEKCANVIHDGFLSSTYSFKDMQTMESTKQFEYKRVVHCKYWIQKIQGKEQADIPDKVYEGIEKEIAKARIKDRSTITPKKVRVWLKKIGCSKYYDHIVSITNHIGGTKPIDIPRDREEKLINLFKEVEEVFMIVKPDYMSNFLSFPYTLYKLCELLEWDDYLPVFKLLSRDERLSRQDDVWKDICARLQWEFYPTTNGY